MEFVKKGEHGTIVIKMPTVPQVLELLSYMGLTTGTLANLATMNDLTLVSKVMGNMGFLVKSVDYKIGEKHITAYEELTNYPHAIGDLIECSAKILSVLSGTVSEEKKTQSETP